MASFSLAGWREHPVARTKQRQTKNERGLSPNIANAVVIHALPQVERWRRRNRAGLQSCYFLLDDFETHLSRRAGDDAEGGFVVTRIEIFGLRFDDVHDLFARDLAHLGFVRFL